MYVKINIQEVVYGIYSVQPKSYADGGSYMDYSRAADDMVQELREMMQEAPDERTKQEFQRFIKKIEQM